MVFVVAAFSAGPRPRLDSSARPGYNGYTMKGAVAVSNFLKRTWAEIDLDALQDNYRAIASSLSGNSRIMAVVKADAYGHGAGMAALSFREAGASWFGVSNLDEAVQLRSAGITEPILVFAYTPPGEAATLARLGISQTVLNGHYARELEQAAAVAGVRVRVHVKIDTGMSRVGLAYHSERQDGDTLREIEALCSLPHLIGEGVFTHFASADEEDDGGYTRQQFERFMGALGRLEQWGVTFRYRHCCNSAGLMRFPDMHLDLVRPGIILYGLPPAPWMRGMLPLRPAMELKTVVSMVKTVPDGMPVSYGRTFVTKGERRLATVPVGYADGYPRVLSNRAQMLLCGQRAPVVGRVCMDQCVLDVTDIPEAREGMTVTVFGKDADACLPVEEIAELAGTIHYETVCLVGKRVPRVFYKNGEIAGRLNYILPDT